MWKWLAGILLTLEPFAIDKALGKKTQAEGWPK